jgi:transketolase
MRRAFIDTLCDLASERDDIVLLCGDLGFSVLESFASRFPQRFFNVGIAEQNMMGIAAGMAAAGKLVFTYSIANFAIARCLEQFRNDVCHHNSSVIAVSVGAGVAYGVQGYSHYGIEDVGFTRSLPNIAVVSPGDQAETIWALRHLVARRGPASLRLGKGGEPRVHNGPLSGPLGSAIELRPAGRDVTILCSGSPLPECSAAAFKLAEAGRDVGLLSVPTVHPLDEQAISDAARVSRLLVSVEEHVVEAGFGGAVAEVVAGLSGPRSRLLRAGVSRGGPKRAASQQEARRLDRFDAQGLVEQIEQALKAEPAL